MKILAIDGNSIISRAFYGIRRSQRQRAFIQTRFTVFFPRTSKPAMRSPPDASVVCWDLKSPTYRHMEYAEYKAGRRPHTARAPVTDSTHEGDSFRHGRHVL